MDIYGIIFTYTHRQNQRITWFLTGIARVICYGMKSNYFEINNIKQKLRQCVRLCRLDQLVKLAISTSDYLSLCLKYP